MPVPVLYPKVSLEMSSGVISRWLVSEGAAVTAGQVLFEIENDKAAVEVEAPVAGILHGLVGEGVEVEVGEAVARILAAGEADSAAPPAPLPAGPAAAKPSAAVAGAAVAAAQSRRQDPNPTPLARRIAREHSLNLTGLAGTGPRGRVQRSDVMAELERLASAPPTEPMPVSVPVSAPVSERVAEPAEGGALHAVWLRQGKGLPVVMLHGFSGDLNNWRGLLAGARVDWPCLALDLPCHGASPRLLPAGLDGIAALVEARLAAEGIGECVIAAHSFGGAVAARLASRGQVDVRGLCLFAPAGLHPLIDQDFTRGILRARRPESLRPWLEQLVHDPKVISPAFVQAVTRSREDDGLTGAMQAFADQFFPDGTQGFGIRDDLARLGQPVRVVFGQQDRILPFASTRGLPGHVGLHALEHCGHMPHLEHPALALRLLAELWRSAV